MILKFDEHQKKFTAGIKKVDRTEEYEFSLLFCDNPVCACNTVHMDLSPLGNEDAETKGSSLQISIDVVEKKLAYPPGKKIPKAQMAFAKAFLSELDDEDYAFLWREYFAYKYRMTEKSRPSEIEAAFDYEAVETEGLMYAYRDVLPFGEPLEIVIDDEKYIIFDTHCVRPGCSCTDTTLSIFSAAPSRKEKIRHPVCDVALTYGNKSWAPYENRALSISVDTVRLAIENQIPGFYKKLKERHRRLKRIYAECKKKHESSQQPLPSKPAQKVARNAPCPCGSGKKYKKCCGK